jgi:tetratricopeptide (TPR) repeat protein
MIRHRVIVAAWLAWGLPCRVWGANPASTELTQGIQAYQDQRWTEAMGHFLQVLFQDPSNHEAHAYFDLLAQQIESDWRRTVHDDRLMILASATQVLDARRMDSSPVEVALRHTTTLEADHASVQRHAQCTMAQMEAQLGHLPTANDLVLRVIAENPNDGEAQRLLSDLQSQIHQTLDTRKDLSLPERRTLEGFYAYGQADYASAAAAWGQARSALEQSLPGPEAIHQAALLHFESYEKVARAHVAEELETARLRVLFGDGVAAYEKQDFTKALDSFRQVALANQTYPQLGQYLVQSEVAVERKRTSDLSETKRQEVAAAFAKGMASLEKGNDTEAKAAFEAVLALDPSHPQAKLYLVQIQSQKPRSTDPAAGQQHYEAGLIAFVGGEMEQAIREWHIALRFDPDNPKVTSALNKVQRELASASELP